MNTLTTESRLSPASTQKLLNFTKSLREELNRDEQLWLSGYLFGLSQTQSADAGLSLQEPPKETQVHTLRILYGSQTGNSKKVAKKAESILKQKQLTVILTDMNEYDPKKLKSEDFVLIVVSTYGDGEPPSTAETLHSYLFSAKASKLNNLNFAVIALGDKSYPKFCQTGIEFDQQLEKLGGTRTAPRIDLDTDFEDDALLWLELYASTFDKFALSSQIDSSDKIDLGLPSKKTHFSRKSPYYATVIEKIQLNGRGSAKETWHIELDLADSGLDYKPGDAVAIIPENCPKLVQKILETANLDADTPVEWESDLLPLEQILIQFVELRLITKELIQAFAIKTENITLNEISENSEKLSHFCSTYELLDLLMLYPADWTASELVGVLRKIQPRLYSISSSLTYTESELHITVAAVRYELNAIERTGTASCHVADRIQIGDKLRIYIEENEYFALPESNETPMIWIGAGTGIAPFRAFAQEMEHKNKTNPAWLFFGNPNFSTDFLYQTEWQKWVQNSVIKRIDLAWSRDSTKKVYVQHKLQEKGESVYEWIKQGAIMYVCGDKTKLAKDVEATLVSIVQEFGQKSHKDALLFVKNLKKNRRYIEDVY